MTVQWEIIAREGFQFFGKMSASISHEIKNALAIINENAGLLEDFMLLAEKGRPIDPERLKSLAGQVMKQVKRADDLVKRMNRFAHSADEPSKNIDLGETLELITSIAQRLASRRDARVDLVIPEQSEKLATNPFLLENLIWLVLDFILAAGHKAVHLLPESTEDGPRIRFSLSGPWTSVFSEGFPSGKEKALLEALKADLRMDPEAGEIILAFRKNR
jgi:signal transduction histidine kinase